MGHERLSPGRSHGFLYNTVVLAPQLAEVSLNEKQWMRTACLLLPLALLHLCSSSLSPLVHWISLHLLSLCSRCRDEGAALVTACLFNSIVERRPISESSRRREQQHPATDWDRSLSHRLIESAVQSSHIHTWIIVCIADPVFTMETIIRLFIPSREQ